MALITDYTSLQAAVADHLNRTDMAAPIPVLIQLAEARFTRRWRGVTSIVSGSNWLIAGYPDVYLYGTLLAAAPYLKDDARVAMWQEIYDARVAEVRHPDTSSNFTDYAGLKRAVADWLDRADLDTVIPHFIRLGEGKLARDYRLRDITCRGTFTITADGDGLPDDFRELEDWYHDGPTYRMPIDIVPGTEIPSIKMRYGATGVPRAAVIADNRFYYAPSPDQAYTTYMIYWIKNTPLDDSNDTNWLLTNHPDIYLHAALIEAAPYLGDDKRVAMWQQLLEQKIEDFWQDIWRRRVARPSRRLRFPIGG